MKQRHNIQTIAEVLIDKLNDLEKLTERVEKASEKALKVDDKDLKETLVNQTNQIKTYLSDFKSLSAKSQYSLPNWLFVLITGSFLVSFGFIYYSWTKIEDYNFQKSKADYFQAKFNEINSSKP